MAANLEGDVYRVGATSLVAEPGMLARSSARQAKGGCSVIGFDFPIGIPGVYARQAKIRSFLEVLPEFGTGRWQRFYDLAARPGEISVERPFYPFRSGGTRQVHLVQGLGVVSMNDLLRRCDFGDGHRNNACSLYWTLGGNQVGRAAISGWREALVPATWALRGELGVWPYDGDLRCLVSSRACSVVETYPAEACVQLGLPAPGRGWSKRNSQDRGEQGAKLLRWAKDKPIDLAKVQAALENGFGDAKVGEDQFDALVGLLGILAVVLDLRTEGAPREHPGLSVEGWILGQRSVSTTG
ncbi:MAG: DUF429 domain-containing protein [Candidatus Tectomicrobia bacterium]|nr:DUF429 domain-containing protein [Candidatus Tectomicrobia bacterium]